MGTNSILDDFIQNRLFFKWSLHILKIAKVNSGKINRRLAGLGLTKDLIAVWTSLINEKFQDEAINIFENLDISRERIDEENRSNILLRFNKKSYDVSIEIEDEGFLHFCTCPHRPEARACSHAGAILIYKMLKDEKNEFNTRSKYLLKVMKIVQKNQGGLRYFKELFPKVQNKLKNNFIYFNFEDFDKDSQILRLQRGVIKKDGSYSRPMKFTGKDFNFNKLKASKKVSQLLSFIITSENYGMSYTANGFSKDRFYDVNTDSMMPIFKELYFDEQELILGATFAKEKFHIRFEVSKKSEGVYRIIPFFVSGKRKVSLINMDINEIGLNSLWVFDNKERCFYQHKDCLNLAAVKNIVRFPKELTLSEKELKEFFNKYYQDVLDSFEFSISKDFRRENQSIIPKSKLYLERDGIKIKIKLRFDYGGYEVDYFSETKELVIIKKDVIYEVSRDLKEEEKTKEFLKTRGVIVHKKYGEFQTEGDLIDFVVNEIPVIHKEGIKIYGEKNLFNFKIVKSRAEILIEVKNNVDWFDIKGEVRFGKDKIQMEGVLEAIFQNKRFVELGDGKKGLIPKNWISELRAYKGFFNTEGRINKLSKYHVSVLESLINLSKKSKIDDEVKKVLNKFKGFQKIKSVNVSKNITANLREYQKVGYGWLNFLREYEFNGILADDMGLGKTLQSLCILQKIKDGGNNGPFLVVMPTSLVFNWKNEIKKFAPKLKTYIHTGTNRVKNEKGFDKAIKDCDIVITSYGTLRNDLALFIRLVFDYIILDEAHMIKNPLSVTTKSVNLLRGKSKLAISGTPIQNNLMELWSLFNFLSPGYLGSYDSFRENFVNRIEIEKNKDVVKSLKKMIDPFLLKRSKEVISNELPPKTEQILRSSFSEDEKIVYNNWKDFYSSEITRSLKEKGLNKSRLKILEGITKLRQASLHPKMIDSKYAGRSAKFDLLIMEIEKALSEGHKVLVFSSFVKMLTIIKGEFNERGINYSYLDGSSVNREKIVNDFQENKNALPFLISIKAGGVGLNLTAADYIFIVDPWWNPAVELQAMDRAHRIGQTKPIFVYKMIAEGSIEEKILELQESKKDLVKDIIPLENKIAKEIDSEMIKEIFG